VRLVIGDEQLARRLPLGRLRILGCRLRYH
jgi:hypothetical protein